MAFMPVSSCVFSGAFWRQSEVCWQESHDRILSLPKLQAVELW